MALDTFITSRGLLSTLLTLVLCFSFCILGAAIGGRQRKPQADLLVGWGAACLAYCILGTLTSIPFIWIDALFVFCVLGASAFLIRNTIPLRLEEPFGLLLLSLPFIGVVSSMQPSMWDEMTHWLPNAHYLIANQHFPGAGYPVSSSDHAGYPYGLPLVVYGVEMAARMLHTSIWQSGTAPVFNVILLIAAASMIMALFYEQRPLAEDAKNRWAARALALLAVTLLCPGFVSHIVLSAYSDNATSVDFLAMGIWLARSRNQTKTRPIIQSREKWQLALLLVLAVCLKEDNALPVSLMVSAAGFWQWRCGMKFLSMLQSQLMVCLPMLAITLLWHSYANMHIAHGEMSIRPFSEWRPDLACAIAKGFAVTALHKSGYFFCAIAITLFGVQQCLRKPQTHNTPGILAFITGCAFLGYNLFLAFAYISIFSPEEAERVASLWRYNAHFGLLETAVMTIALARMKAIPLLNRPTQRILISAVCIAPLALATQLRGDQTPFMTDARNIGHDIARQMQEAGGVLLIDTARNGLDCVIIRFQLADRQHATACVNELNIGSNFTEPLSRSQYLWTDGWPPIAQSITGLSLSTQQAHFLHRSAVGNWEAMRSWPKLHEGK